MTLYNKYRPLVFADILEQEKTIKILKNSVKLDHLSQAYLFFGPRGVGKTTAARIFGKAVNCLSPEEGEPCGKCANCLLIASKKELDLVEIDAASHTGVDNIRELKETLNSAPSLLKRKVYIIDEAHMLSRGAFNALLKSLEEPPAGVIFILATTEIEKIPKTIISRCQRLEFKAVSNKGITERLKTIAQKEKVKVEEGALCLLTSAAEGGMRDAISLLDQVMRIEDKLVTQAEVQKILGLPDFKKTFLFLESLKKEDLRAGFLLIQEIAYSGYDISSYTKNLLDTLRNILVLKINPAFKKELSFKIAEDALSLTEEMARSLSVNQLGRFISRILTAQAGIKDSPLPHLPLELALLDLIKSDSDSNPNSTSTPTTHANSNSNKNNSAELNPKSKTPPKAQVKTESKSEPEPELESELNSESPLTAPAKAKNTNKENIATDFELEKKPIHPKELSDSNSKTKTKIDPESKPTTKTDPPIIAKNNANPDSSQEPESGSKAQKPSANKIGIEKVCELWPKILDGVKSHNCSLWGILQNCYPVGLDGTDRAIVKVKYGFHKEQLENMNNKRLIQGVIGEILDSGFTFCYLLDKEIPADLKKNQSTSTLEIISEFGGEVL